MLTPIAGRFPANLIAARMEFAATERREADAISQFLERTFALPPGAPLVDRRHMHWKYWAVRPDWPGSRSFTGRRNGAIVAHAATWPVRVRVPHTVFDGVHLIDWAADASCPGAGIWLVRQIRAKVQLMIATGGRDMTKRILPALGFRKHGEVCTFARSIRPLAQALTTTARNWRLVPRFARNLCWRVAAPLASPDGWEAVPIEPEQLPADLWPEPSVATAVTSRDAAVYRFYADAPAVRHALWGLALSGELRGYFCLAFAPHVARIADLWLPSTSVDDWCAAYRTAAITAARERDVYEISTWASIERAKEALARAGFRMRDRAAITVFGGAQPLGGRELHVQMLDCDASFLSGGASYLT